MVTEKVEVSEETSDEEFNQSMDPTSPTEVGTYEIKVTQIVTINCLYIDLFIGSRSKIIKSNRWYGK